ncbi:MFS transporter [Sporomusa acidovorans]|uniref:Niacin/nicotinamide transporter NaiP n=1 Tax=Sporomusa acidovorans (strain ATCC 49682 / DSM 3132 / Mol) TaxID=1123286 RepID=A0ABZ3J022_SPOA4|nr:MFS transporter [Sporomusa acidovorans]OZC24219.1 putative niacin/nicotinamide transporter NaiP [Sporomusa acidovorans DSM 3132]SDF55684.1 MFS transporter, putative metabolite:H+ symporter [Sporomusa acidovorans]
MDIIRRLEQIPVSRFHYKLLVLTGLGWLFDAMDTGIIAFVLPVLAKEWGLSTAQMGFIGSIGLLGMAVGAVAGGLAADKFGRKAVFSITLILYSIATGLCGLAWNYESLLLFRFLVGFGLGGELPVAATLMTEYSPPASRGRFIVLLESFWGVGWLAAALISYLVIPYLGWQMAFFIGALPALYVFFIRLGVPESIRYLTDKGRQAEAIEIVAKLERLAGVDSSAQPAATSNVEFSDSSGNKIAFKELWTSRFAKRTIILWIIWFGIVYSYYGIFTWLPSLMVQQGHTVIKTFEYVLIMTLAQLPGYFSAAYLIDRIGRKATLAGYLALSAVSAYFFGQGGSPQSILVWGSLMSFFNLGAWGVVYTYTPELYPTRIRAFGSGWAAAVGRFGGILAPTIVGYMISGPQGLMHVFTMFTGVMLLVAVAVWLFGEETKGKALDEISR